MSILNTTELQLDEKKTQYIVDKTHPTNTVCTVAASANGVLQLIIRFDENATVQSKRISQEADRTMTKVCEMLTHHDTLVDSQGVACSDTGNALHDHICKIVIIFAILAIELILREQ